MDKNIVCGSLLCVNGNEWYWLCELLGSWSSGICQSGCGYYWGQQVHSWMLLTCNTGSINLKKKKYFVSSTILSIYLFLIQPSLPFSRVHSLITTYSSLPLPSLPTSLSVPLPFYCRSLPLTSAVTTSLTLFLFSLAQGYVSHVIPSFVMDHFLWRARLAAKEQLHIIKELAKVE